MFDTFKIARIDKIEGTIEKILQTVKRYFQCVNEINCLAMIAAERDSNRKGGTYNRMSHLMDILSLKNMILRLGLRFRPNNIRAP